MRVAKLDIPNETLEFPIVIDPQDTNDGTYNWDAYVKDSVNSEIRYLRSFWDNSGTPYADPITINAIDCYIDENGIVYIGPLQTTTGNSLYALMLIYKEASDNRDDWMFTKTYIDRGLGAYANTLSDLEQAMLAAGIYPQPTPIQWSRRIEDATGYYYREYSFSWSGISAGLSYQDVDHVATPATEFVSWQHSSNIISRLGLSESFPAD